MVDVAGKRAFAEAGLTPDDIDVAGIYDSFTITVALQIEDLGFCGAGEAGTWVAEGNMDLGGEHAAEHPRRPAELRPPGACGGMLHFVEAIRQLRGEAGDSQVQGARGAGHTASAVASNFSVTILGRPD